MSLKLSLLCGPRPKSATASPQIWLTPFQTSSKSVNFRQSYCRMHEDRFCPIEYFQYRLFEPIISLLKPGTSCHSINLFTHFTHIKIKEKDPILAFSGRKAKQVIWLRPPDVVARSNFELVPCLWIQVSEYIVHSW